MCGMGSMFDTYFKQKNLNDVCFKQSKEAHYSSADLYNWINLSDVVVQLFTYIDSVSNYAVNSANTSTNL